MKALTIAVVAAWWAMFGGIGSLPGGTSKYGTVLIGDFHSKAACMTWGPQYEKRSGGLNFLGCYSGDNLSRIIR